MSQAGKIVVVSGATGVVGGGIARRFLEEGATVIASLRSEGSKARLEAALAGAAPFDAARLHTPVADWGTEEGAAALADFIKDSAGGVVDHVISIAGGGVGNGLATSLEPSHVGATVKDKLAGHILLARHVLPLVREDAASSWTVVSGIVGEVLFHANMALLGICNSAVYAFCAALQEEKKRSAVRINEMRIAAVIVRDGEGPNPKYPDWPSYPATKLGDVVLKVAGGSQGNEVIRVRGDDLS